MSTTLLELTAEIVASHASTTAMTSDELLQEISKVFTALQQLEGGTIPTETTEVKQPTITLKKAFQANQVICLICGKDGMKTLSRHLSSAHGMKPSEYRKQFNIPRTQSLTAKNFSETRREMATQRNLADNLAKARAVRAAKKVQVASKPGKAAKKK
jgi:predicted transcriptional regulator